MNRPVTIADWLAAHKKTLIVHGSILFAFMMYAFFLAGPLFDRFEGIAGRSKLHDVSLPSETNNIRYDLILYTSTRVTEALGWAFVEGQSPENSQTYLVLRSADTTYVFDTVPMGKSTSTKGWVSRDPALSWAGFAAVIATDKVRAGEYDVGIYITKGNSKALQYTDKVFLKSGNTVQSTTRTSKLQRIPPAGDVP